MTIFSFNIWSHIQPLSNFSMFEGKTLFDLLDFLTSNVMLPLGGLLMAIFVGWRLKNTLLTEALEMSENRFGYQLWRFLIRFVTPIGVTLIFLNAIGLF